MRQIFVDSRDRSSGTSANFEVPLPQTLSLNPGHQARIDDLRLPNAIPTISVANNTLQVWINGQYKTALQRALWRNPAIFDVLERLL